MRRGSTGRSSRPGRPRWSWWCWWSPSWPGTARSRPRCWAELRQRCRALPSGWWCRALPPLGGETEARDDEAEPDREVPWPQRRRRQVLAGDVEQRDPGQADQETADHGGHQPAGADLRLAGPCRRGVDRLGPAAGFGHVDLLIQVWHGRARPGNSPVPAAARTVSRASVVARPPPRETAPGWAA